ncbi:MAG: hypothetical protein KA322_03500 [Chitinophagales bacterium]|nr:hypothetical protein [Chitinophagales bacterium]
MRKQIQVLLLFFFTSTLGFSQNCFNLIADMSGIDNASYQTELEAAACELRNAFPEEFRNDFKVFDFGFYSMTEYMQGGFQAVWDNKIKPKAAADSKYYLLFGKQTDSKGVYSKYWVDLKLPTTGAFECMDILSPSIRTDLIVKYNFLINRFKDKHNSDYFKYAQIEKELMLEVKKFILKNVDCCETSGGRSTPVCTACVYEPDDLISLQIANNFLLDPVFVVTDPDSTDFPSLWGRKETGSRSSTSPLNINVKFQDNTASALDAYVELFQSEHISDIGSRTGISTGISLHTFKYPRDCASYDKKWSDYQADNADYKIFVSIINIDNKVAVLGFHNTVKDLSGSSTSNLRNSNGDIQILKDEMEGIIEIREEVAQPCEEFVSATANLIIARYGTQIISLQGPGSPMYQLSVHYDKLAKAGFSEAQYEMGIYWAKEYEAVKKQYDNWSECWAACSIRAKWRTTGNLCGGVIHTALDMCGLIPVLGEVCDGTNSILYLSTGDLKNAALSAAAVIPIAGYGAVSAKYAGKLWKPIAGCAGGSGLRESGSGYCRMLTFTITASGKVKWRGGRPKLYSLMKDYINMAGKEAHHLIPWDEGGHNIMKILASKGWHISNPVHNGFAFPAALHGNHPALNKGVREILDKLDGVKITNSMSGSDVIATMKKFTDQLTAECNKAIANGTYINDHFAKVDWNKIYQNI